MNFKILIFSRQNTFLQIFSIVGLILIAEILSQEVMQKKQKDGHYLKYQVVYVESQAG